MMKYRGFKILAVTCLGVLMIPMQRALAQVPGADWAKTYDLAATPVAAHDDSTALVGDRTYECKNHLENVLVAVSDRKVSIVDATNLLIAEEAELRSTRDYYPFGMDMPGRQNQPDGYRYGFGGKELDDEVKGNGNSYDFTGRFYDPRIGRWMNPDPLESQFPRYSTYTYAANNPIVFTDPDGAAPKPASKVATSIMVGYDLAHGLDIHSALLGANNTSPEHFEQWARGERSFHGTTNILGAVGEAVALRNLKQKDVKSPFSFSLGYMHTRQFGGDWEALQIDIMQFGTIGQTTFVAPNGRAAYHEEQLTFPIYNRITWEEEGVSRRSSMKRITPYVVNYEVKTLDPTSNPKDILERIKMGMMQVSRRNFAAANVFGVLVTDRAAWEAVIADPIYGAELQVLANLFLSGKNQYLILQDNLYLDAEKHTMTLGGLVEAGTRAEDLRKALEEEAAQSEPTPE